MAGEVGIANSLAWSPDERIFYFADTIDQTIYAYDHVAGPGTIADRRIFATTLEQPGSPDGSTVDAQGYLWNTQWDGWRLVRYSPDGQVDRVIDLPVQKPTSCIFGGPDLRTLYITSAIWDHTEADLVGQPWAGSLLAVEVDVPGLPETRFKG